MGGEAHVVLPYQPQLFLRDSVEIMPDANWGQRYQSVLARATEVVIVSGQKFSEGSVSYDYANQVLLGLAIIRAEQLGTKLSPLGVWDGSPGDGPGGTCSNVERWRRLGYEVELIDLKRTLEIECPELRTTSVAGTPCPKPESPLATLEAPPKIVAIMFADAKGFSKLTEEQTPRFVRHFLGMVGEMARSIPQLGPPPGHQQPTMTNTWGDGLFFIFENVSDAAGFALDLCDRMQNTAWAEKGLPSWAFASACTPDRPIPLRIRLLSGPIS
jgi:hypothetical protein